MIRAALASRQPIAAAFDWDDATLATVLAELEAHARAMKEARRGR